MSKNLKRWLCVFLTIALCLGIGPVLNIDLNTKAEDLIRGTFNDFDYEQFTEYQSEQELPEDDNSDEIKLRITGYNGNETDVSIPSSINGIPVRSVDGFYNNTVIRSVTIPSGVKEICQNAFLGCSKLTDIDLPDGLKLLNYHAFGDCISLHTITIPSSITDGTYTYGLGRATFKDIYGDSWVIDGPFKGCSNLKKVNFADDAVFIPHNLFKSCSGLESIIIPKTVEEIGGDAFFDTNLYTVTFEDGSNLKTIGSDAFRYTNLRTIDIPDSVEVIGSDAFSYTDLNELVLPKNLRFFGFSAIAYTNINSITIPKSIKFAEGCFVNSNVVNVNLEPGLKKIPRYMFERSIISDIDIPESVTEIEEYAFIDCENLHEITIPESVLIIGQNAFQKRYLKTIYGYSGSKAEEYANESDILFIPIGDASYIQKKSGSFRIQTADEVLYETKEDNRGFYYSDSYFLKPSNIYNPSLATMSLSMAFSTYGAKHEVNNEYLPDYDNFDKNVHSVMKQCGLTGDDDENYASYHYNEKPTKDSIACAIGSKTLPGDYTLIAIAVRGGGYASEWASNFQMGLNGDHVGFDVSANSVVSYLQDYISKKCENVPKSKIKVWLTGFSRGAAVATQTAAKLSNPFGFHLSKDNIYAYGFATPAGGVSDRINDKDIHGKDFDNIFNVVSFYDPVPLVAPQLLGFDRYGTTYILPYSESASKDIFKNYIAEVKNRMGDNYITETISTFADLDVHDANSVFKMNKVSIGSFMRRAIQYISYDLDSRQEYVDWFQDDLIDAMIRSEGDVTFEYGKTQKAWFEFFRVVLMLLPDFGITHPAYASTFLSLNNLKAIFNVHANPDYYLTCLRLMDPNYPDNLPVQWGEEDYRAVSINCPVDVYVYDNDNNLVASIVDEQPVSIDSSGITTSIDENDTKIVYLPISEEYKLKVIAREECKITYNVDEYDALTGKQTRNVSYSSISADKKEALVGNIEAFSVSEIENGADEGSKADYSLFKNNNKLSVTHDYSSNEIETNQYEVKLQKSDNGLLYGGGTFTEGSFAKIIAVPADGFHIDGFFVNGKEINDDDLDNDSSTVRFEVHEDSIVSAKFVKNNEEPGNNEVPEESANDLDPSVNGIVQCPDGRWAMYKNGKVDTTCTTIAQNKYGWWRVENGYVNFEAQGIYQNKFGWWKTTNGKVTFKETGIFENENGTWRVENSKVNFAANGIYQGKDGWYKTTNGKVTFKENGIFQNQFGWWYVKNSKVDFDYTGIASNNYGKWYINKGKVDFTKVGFVKVDGKTYTVMFGKVIFG